MAGARKIAKVAFTLSLLALATLIAVPAVTGRPFVSYASSGSMEPTIGVLDGFLVDPWPGSIEPGDIVVFFSVTRQGPAVHRIVAVDGDGWLTQGDANEDIDQRAGEPVLTRERVLGKVVTDRDGNPIIIERLGATLLESRAKLVTVEDSVGGPRALAAIGFLLLALSFAVPALFARRKRQLPTRLPLRARVLLRRLLPRGILGRHVAVALLLVVLASTIVAGANAEHEVTTTLISLQDPSAADDTRATGPGGELRRDVDVASLGWMPTVVIVDTTEHVRATHETTRLAPNERAKIEIWQRAGDVVGIQEDTVSVWRYPAVLPASMLLALHHAVPGSPYVALGLLLIALGAAWFAYLRVQTLPVARTLGIQEEWL